jgi:hypothetical protein
MIDMSEFGSMYRDAFKVMGCMAGVVLVVVLAVVFFIGVEVGRG